MGGNCLSESSRIHVKTQTLKKSVVTIISKWKSQSLGGGGSMRQSEE